MDPQRLFGPITTRTLRIDQFDTFFLNNIPYAEVPPESVNWGAIEYDGPDAQGIAGGKPALQWHFGGIAYPITRAMRINYTYVRKWDGSNDIITTSIYLGFQENFDQYILSQAIPFVADPTETFDRRVNNIGMFEGFSTHSWASDAGVLASEAEAVITRSVDFDAVNLRTFTTLMQEELTDPIFVQLLMNAVPVDFDGPAQDYDSHRPFQYTFATLQNEPEKYSQLLFWYFGGKPFRITKAMRIPLDDGGRRSSLVLASAKAREGQFKVLRDAHQEVRKQQQRVHARSKQLAEATDKQTPEERLTPIREDLTKAEEELPKAQNKLTTAQAAWRELPLEEGGKALFVGYSGPDPAG